jgi:hypothetical protein
MALIGRCDPLKAVRWLCANNVRKGAEQEVNLISRPGQRGGVCECMGVWSLLHMLHSTLCIDIHLNSRGAAGAFRDITMQCVLQVSCGCAATAASIRQQSLLGAQPCMSAPRRQLQAGPQQRQRQQRRPAAVVVQAGGGFGKPAEKALSKQKVCPCGTGLAYKASRVDLPAELCVGPPQVLCCCRDPLPAPPLPHPVNSPHAGVCGACVSRLLCCRHPSAAAAAAFTSVTVATHPMLPAAGRCRSAASRTTAAGRCLPRQRRSCARATLLMSRGCGHMW